MHCHDNSHPSFADGSPVILVGNPNVGKSVLFGSLTGRYVTVANFPGTTVELAHGTLNLNGQARPIIDTPGIQSIIPLSDDERVTRDILLSQSPTTIVQVVDTKNLRRGLLIALELIEAGLPFVLNLNMADEAVKRGIQVNASRLSEILGVPVVSTVATRGLGIDDLVRQLGRASAGTYNVTYDPALEAAIVRLADHLPQTPLAARSLALMVLAGDHVLPTQLALSDVDQTAIRSICQETEQRLTSSLAYAINRRRLEAADQILATVVQRRPARSSWLEELGPWMTHPIWGWPILAGLLYLVYLFVGVFGAGTLVDLLETRLFGEVVNPWATGVVQALIPIPLVQDFLVGEYGLVSMALTYSLAIVLPIVGTFFLAFSLLEDSGYLPRLAVMLNRSFRLMGLNGKAVLPMILGLGCATMATMTTRVLESRKERLQVTLLLALGVPCSAQLGVILGMIADLGATATLIWAGVVTGTLLTVGYLAAQLIPGQPSDFILELPPVRVPSFANIVVKTIARLEWYLKEVVPVFAVGTTALFVLDQTGLLATIERLLSPIVVGWLNLPAQVSGVLLVGFLRRDYGAAGLFAVARAGELSSVQILVSLVVITLFMPCIANLLMIVKEYGLRTAVAVAAFVFPFAIAVGGLLNLVLRSLNILVK
jgi:ferrous iron transport protein B